ncbi:MAG: DUF4783 domain-containing protein [Flavobacteriales bacterium]|nr:DUF4783 domain-containing protein [Flavobacteriales bacterium]MCB0783314.1 DUF4783 domain-containing protein [Flavobacteriales bacterium]MCB0788813.1 DUF4783 domain-containing protein [Flavobacteriales bacterium]MCB0808145.1 DUF4783 domain-containing protein [Flavobacteriales bacterium]MCB0811992.1 DUF4783 domain-containing protein [Flavobacteriales bacterium]
MSRWPLFVLFLLASLAGRSQEAEKDRVVEAISSGDPGSLSELFIPNLDLTVNGTGDVYSKAQAEQILRKFFDEHPPVDLVIEHSGVSKFGDKYFIGILRTRTGYFRVTFFLKKMEQGFLVKQLRIEDSKSDF